MRQVLRYLVVLPVVVWCAVIAGMGVVHAVVHSLNYTTGQDTIITSKIVPDYNRTHCETYGLTVGCTSANLVTAGCVTRNVCQAAGITAGSAACITLSTLSVESCVIYTADATGEDAMLQETENQRLVSVYLQSKSHSAADFKAGFAAANGTNQNTACTASGQPSGCDGP